MQNRTKLWMLVSKAKQIFFFYRISQFLRFSSTRWIEQKGFARKCLSWLRTIHLYRFQVLQSLSRSPWTSFVLQNIGECCLWILSVIHCATTSDPFVFIILYFFAYHKNDLRLPYIIIAKSAVLCTSFHCPKKLHLCRLNVAFIFSCQ